MNHRAEYENLMKEYDGRAAIGHVRYATCGADDRSYAQPFERHHIKKHKWFSFAFNGQLANYAELRKELLADDDNHLARETDTEIFMHEICHGRCRSTAAAAGRRLPADGGEVRRGLQPGVPRRPGRHGRRPRPAGHQAAVLCGRGAAVCRGQRERGPDEPRFRPGEHQVGAAGPGDHHQRRAAGDPDLRPQPRGGPIASSNGSISPTWPARWTAGASTWPARPWARSWPGWRRCPSTTTRWSCPCPTPARRRPTPWPMP